MVRTNANPKGERGVSDTLAFVLTFSIIITSVGLVYSVGFGSLLDIRDTQQDINAQNSFVTIGEDIDEIRDAGAATRSGRLQLRGGSLEVRKNSRIAISINKSETVYDGTLGTLIYRSDETTTIGYESGASFGKYQNSSVMDAPPRFHCGGSSNTSIISVVAIKQAGPSIGSSGTVTVTATKINNSLIFPDDITSDPDVDNVSVTISDSHFQGAWNQAFEDRGRWSRSGNMFTCQTEQVYVRVTVVEIKFDT
jgi:hypothetical protein